MGKTANNNHTPKTVYDHIRELQMRFFASAVALIVGGFAVYAIYEPILGILSAPLGAPLYYSNPTGGFAFVMKICFTGGLIIAIPVLIYNLIMFVRPVFPTALSMKRILLTTLGSTLLAIAGTLFAYYCILPGTLHFFASFQVDGLNALISADEYLGFVTNIIITFIVMFQIPLVIAFIDKIKPLQPKQLLKMEKWVILGSLIIALLVPFAYEFVTSMLIAVPIVALYNLSIILVIFQHQLSAKRAQALSQAIIIKSKQDINSDIAIDQIYDNIADEIGKLAKPATPIVQSLATGSTSTTMDIKKQFKQPEAIKPAAWVEYRKHRHLLINKRTKVFSDIRQSNSNHVLA